MMKVLHHTKNNDVFVLQVGAMDGITFDPVHEFIKAYGWSGLLIEPIKEHFVTLQKTYQGHHNITLANTAIAEHEGTLTMHRIPTKHIASGEVPCWGLGVSSSYRDRNALAFAEIEPFIVQEDVTCTTLSALLKKHKVDHIDVLQIDAEGHDYHILKQLNFEKFHPSVINIEIVNLPKTEQFLAKQLLDKHGYIHAKGGYNLLAAKMVFTP